MTPHITAQRIVSELKTRLETETDPLTRALITDKIQSVSKIIIRESVRINHERERYSRALANTNNPVSIKCGLRGATGHSLPDKQRHWYWDGVSEKEARKLEKVRGKIKELLFWDADKALVRKFFLLGGVKKCLTEIGLPAILSLPESVRRDKAGMIVKLIEEKLNGPEKLPFC